MLYNETKKRIVVDEIKIARSFKERLMGLMFKSRISKNEGLLMLGCNSIHTCFMRFAIDVVFMDLNHRVIFIKEKVKPWRSSGFIKKAYMTLELPEGTVKNKNIAIGDILILS
ncbi:MAG TPA: DUF192 domain-containing protein [Bacillota bacterium]|nr:DUF192 domain-containing protein [Bacillota bacterium]HPL98498.1 DUF192 domain-containing protein [Bacillota bacterium]